MKKIHVCGAKKSIVPEIVAVDTELGRIEERVEDSRRTACGPNLIITPHVAGSVLDLVPINIRDIVSDNLRRLSNGESLKNLVSLG